MLRSEPIKWRKYLKLVEYGLLTLEELKSDIRRYRLDEQGALRKYIEAGLGDDERRGESSLYVVKLVAPYRCGQLPNLRIARERELNNLSAFLRRSNASEYTEVWCCRTLMDSSLLSVAGRLAFDFRMATKGQVVEQVWRCSPRLIESLSSGFSFPYVRASRWSWGWSYVIEKLHLPSGGEWGEEQVRREFVQSMIALEGMRDPICKFLVEVEDAGLHSASLEYKIVGSRLSIIDWDTPDDYRLFG